MPSFQNSAATGDLCIDYFSLCTSDMLHTWTPPERCCFDFSLLVVLVAFSLLTSVVTLFTLSGWVCPMFAVVFFCIHGVQQQGHTERARAPPSISSFHSRSVQTPLSLAMLIEGAVISEMQAVLYTLYFVS